MAGTYEVTENDLLQAVMDAMGESDQPGMTAHDLAQALGITDDALRPSLKELLASGKVVIEKFKRRQVNGFNHTYTGFRLV